MAAEEDDKTWYVITST